MSPATPALCLKRKDCWRTGRLLHLGVRGGGQLGSDRSHAAAGPAAAAAPALSPTLAQRSIRHSGRHLPYFIMRGKVGKDRTLRAAPAFSFGRRLASPGAPAGYRVASKAVARPKPSNYYARRYPPLPPASATAAARPKPSQLPCRRARAAGAWGVLPRQCVGRHQQDGAGSVIQHGPASAGAAG